MDNVRLFANGYDWFSRSFRRSASKISLHALYLSACLAFSQSLFAQVRVCDLESVKTNHYGPYDYFDPKNHESTNIRSEGNVGIVIGAHFTQSMLRLERGNNNFELFADLEYTLNALPNLPAALDLVSRFEEKRKKFAKFREKQRKLKFDAECYFRRAVYFTPQQPYTHMVWGIHHHRNNRFEQAIEQYRIAQQKGMDSAELHYNMGLTYVELQQIEKAKSHAQKAYFLGFPLEGLKNKIIALENK